jgi:hypothetical protein
MILTDYYKFVHLPGCKSAMRRDCTASTKSYPDFESLRNRQGKLFVYFGDVPLQFGGDVHKKAGKAITKTKNISSVYVPDITQNSAFGDVKGTADALLIINNPDCSELEIFVARGYKNHRLNVWQNFIAGEYDFDIANLRKQASPENTDLPI